MPCHGCDKDFREDDLAPYIRNADGTYDVACRRCISDWIERGLLKAIPFWARKQGLDKDIG